MDQERIPANQPPQGDPATPKVRVPAESASNPEFEFVMFIANCVVEEVKKLRLRPGVTLDSVQQSKLSWTDSSLRMDSSRIH